MAFTTIPGTNGNPTTFQGTEGADSIVIVGGSTSDIVFESFVANGEGGDDFINFSGNRANSTIRGGQGNDLITQNIVSGTFFEFFAGGLISGNQGDDVIGNNQLGISATASTINGGQGNDTLFAGNLQTSLLNGNIGNDELFVDDFFGTVNINNASVFGGQGNDTISVDTSGFLSNVNGTKIEGNLGNDRIFLEIDGSFSGSAVSGGEGDDLIDADSLFDGNDLGISDTGLLLNGDAGDDTIHGGAGRDTINGGTEADYLSGGDGRDVIDGGKGDDIISGASLRTNVFFGDGIGDTLSGGTGSNVFAIFPDSSAFAAFFDDNPDGVISQGDTLDTLGVANAFDVITDWAAAAATNLFTTGIAGFATFANPTFIGANMSLGAISLLGLNYAVQGDYNAAEGVFVVNQFGGSDIAVWTYNTIGVGPTGTTSNVTILQDVNPDTTGIFVQENDFTASV